MMADQLFNDSSTVGSTADIPDIFDVLEGGEDEGAVRYLLGFNGDEGGVDLGQVDGFGGMEVMDKFVGDGINLGLTGTYLPSINSAQQPNEESLEKTAVAVRQIHSSINGKKRDTSGAKAIHNCDSCGKSFTTKFNLKRHINMHCHKSKENGVPIQGPPSASAPAKKSDKSVHKTEHQITGLHATENHQAIHLSNPQTVLAQNHTIIHSGPGAVPYSRVVTVPQTEYQRPEPDSTYKLPSVQTILPVSTVYTTSGAVVAAANTFSTVASCDSSQTVSSVTSSSHNTDFGTLPVDLFDPDSSRSEPHTPTSPNGRIPETEPEDDSPQQVTLTSVPAGWTRKVSYESGKATYCSPLGKVFSTHAEIVQYFKTFNFTVPLGLFNFDVNYLEDSEDDSEEDDEDEEDEEDLEESEDEESESICAKRRRNDVQYPGSGYPVPETTPSPGPTPSSSPLA